MLLGAAGMGFATDIHDPLAEAEKRAKTNIRVLGAYLGLRFNEDQGVLERSSEDLTLIQEIEKIVRESLEKPQKNKE